MNKAPEHGHKKHCSYTKTHKQNPQVPATPLLEFSMVICLTPLPPPPTILLASPVPEVKL